MPEQAKEKDLDIKTLQYVIIDALEDMKGQNILVFDTTSLTDLFDRVILATGTSNRQTRALAKNVHDKVKQNGGQIFSSEGEDSGEWVLVDCGDAVVHILQPAIRDYYRLEDIWGETQIPLSEVIKGFRKPVKRKSATTTAKQATKEKPPKKVASPSKKVTSRKEPSKTTATKIPKTKTGAQKSPIKNKKTEETKAKKRLGKLV